MKNLFAIALISLIILFPGSFSVFDKDEPKYTEAAREMIIKSDYITPYYNHEYRFDKPILTYWLIIAGYKLFGINEQSARLFACIFGVLTVVLLFWWSSRWENNEFAFTSALILLSSFDFLIMSSIAMPDIVLTFFISLSLIAFYQGYKTHNKKFFLLSFLSSGFAVLTKGPIGIIIPALIITIYLAVVRRELIKTLKEIPWISGITIFLAIIFPWYGLIIYKHGYDFFKEFIIFHNIHRFFSKIPGHPTHWYYYIINYPWLYFPWSIFFPFATWKLVKEEKYHSITDDFINFNLIWLICTFAFFQIAHTKLAHYLLPTFPAFSIITAWYTHKFKDRPAPKIILTAMSGFLFIVATVIIIFSGMPTYNIFVPFPLFAGSILSTINKNSIKPIATGFLISMLAFKIVTLPSLETARAKPIVGKSLHKLSLKCKSCRFYSLDYTSAEIIYYFQDGKLENINYDRAKKVLMSDEPVFIVTRENRLKRLKAQYYIAFRKKELLTKHYIVLITNSAGRALLESLLKTNSSVDKQVKILNN